MMEKTLGVVGTLVWDRIIDRDERSEPFEEWGGVGYALGALSAAIPAGWRILPIMKVGRDLAEEAYRFLREIPGMDDSAVVIVPDAHNRVELRYESEARRFERLTGGVPPWTWPELAPIVEICDALYVNFISGFEMELETAQALRVGYRRPTYADLHSLFLHMTQHGLRVPRTLDAWQAWLRCFDAVQMNEDEFKLLGADGDSWQLASEAIGPDLRLIMVTLGWRGAAYLSCSDFSADPFSWRQDGRLAVSAGAHTGKIGLTDLPRTGDPTGCGDVWGATAFARLLAGDDLEEAMGHGNRLAGRNVEHKGARGLSRHLAGKLSQVEERR
jgi:sugar/nucleoside kinase (ribokinase family)